MINSTNPAVASNAISLTKTSNTKNRTKENTSSSRIFKFANKSRDKWSFLTHLLGAILATIGTIYLFVSNFSTDISELGRLITMTLFGLSMIALYTSSSIYHYCPGPAEKIAKLRKLDHAMIYVLIAGTYTPVLYNGLDAPKSIIFLIVIWTLGIGGIVLKMFFINTPRWLYTLLYIVMGWAIVFDPIALISLPFNFLILLLAGGISYTVGAMFYIIKKPNISEVFGFHELFHCFILLGTLLQFVGVAYYL